MKYFLKFSSSSALYVLGLESLTVYISAVNLWVINYELLNLRGTRSLACCCRPEL